MLLVSLALLGQGVVWAVGLGEAQLDSHLGEPLRARVDITGVDDPQALVVEIAGAEQYRELGAAPETAASLQVGAVTTTANGWYVLVTSTAPIDDLVLDVVLVLQGPGIQATRHYPLLLDPPPAVQSPRTIAPEPAPRRAAPAPPTRVRTDIPISARTVTVAAGDHLYGIARRLRRGGENLDAMADQLFALNPHAFINGDRNLLRAGAILEMPVLDSSQDAPAPDRVRRAGRSDETDQIRVRAPPTSGEIIDTLQRWVNVTPEQLAAGRLEAQRDLSFARTEIQTYRNQNENLRGRIDGLEQRIDKLRRLMAMKAELRDLTAAEATRLEQSVAPTGGLVAGVPPPAVADGAPPQPAPTVSSAADEVAPSPPQPWWRRWGSVLGAVALVALVGVGGARLAIARRRRSAPQRPRADELDWLPDGL